MLKSFLLEQPCVFTHDTTSTIVPITNPITLLSDVANGNELMPQKAWCAIEGIHVIIALGQVRSE